MFLLICNIFPAWMRDMAKHWMPNLEVGDFQVHLKAAWCTNQHSGRLANQSRTNCCGKGVAPLKKWFNVLVFYKVFNILKQKQNCDLVCSLLYRPWQDGNCMWVLDKKKHCSICLSHVYGEYGCVCFCIIADLLFLVIE